MTPELSLYSSSHKPHQNQVSLEKKICKSFSHVLLITLFSLLPPILETSPSAFINHEETSKKCTYVRSSSSVITTSYNTPLLQNLKMNSFIFIVVTRQYVRFVFFTFIFHEESIHVLRTFLAFRKKKTCLLKFPQNKLTSSACFVRP